MLNDNSEKDVEILQKKIGADYKTFIKQRWLGFPQAIFCCCHIANLWISQ